MAKSKHVDAAIDVLIGLGAAVEVIQNKHRKVRFELAGHKLIWNTSLTPSDFRTQYNELAQLRRLIRGAGIEPPLFGVRQAGQTVASLEPLWALFDEVDEENNRHTES